MPAFCYHKFIEMFLPIDNMHLSIWGQHPPSCARQCPILESSPDPVETQHFRGWGILLLLFREAERVKKCHCLQVAMLCDAKRNREKTWSYQVETGKDLWFMVSWQALNCSSIKSGSLWSHLWAVWLLYLAMLHAHIIDIKSNTFFWNVQSMKSIYWIHAMYLVLEKVLWVRKKKCKASATPWWTCPPFQPHLFLAFTPLISTSIHQGSPLPGLYHLPEPTLKSEAPTSLLWFLLAHLWGSDLISEQRQVFTRISWEFLHPLLHQLTHRSSHSHSLPLKALLYGFGLSLLPSLSATWEPEIQKKCKFLQMHLPRLLHRKALKWVTSTTQCSQTPRVLLH